jgi:hypothetical protein
METYTCQSCGYDYSRKHGYAHLSFGKGDDAIEQLQSWSGQIEVCVNCANVLRSWMGMEQYPAPPRGDLEDLAPAPFSCYDERLQYSRD